MAYRRHIERSLAVLVARACLAIILYEKGELHVKLMNGKSEKNQHDREGESRVIYHDGRKHSWALLACRHTVRPVKSHCEATATQPGHRVVCLFTPSPSQVLSFHLPAGSHGGIARLSWPEWLEPTFRDERTVTHPGTNRARRWVTTLIETNAIIALTQTAASHVSKNNRFGQFFCNGGSMHTGSHVSSILIRRSPLQTRSQTVVRIADRTASQHFSGSSDVIGHVTIWYPFGHFLLVVLWNQASISIGFRDIQWQCDAMVDMALIRPLNKGQGHSFCYQSISHIGLPINFCSSTHRLATVHSVQATDGRKTVG